MYALGRGVTKDDALVLAWYRKAAAQGNGDAEANLGNVFAQGRGVAPDQVEAADWYRKAAAHGSARARRILASLENNGAATAIVPDAALPLATKPDPKPVKTVMAEYPVGARRDSVTGHVTGRMLIDEKTVASSLYRSCQQLRAGFLIAPLELPSNNGNSRPAMRSGSAK